MIKIEHTDVYGWEAAIRGARNPMNSWDKSDSSFEYPENDYPCRWTAINIEEKQGWMIEKIGKNDLKLMRTLAKAGSDHGKFLRMINVTCDITAPLYWWKEFDTYKVGTVANSCSTMHKIQAKEFTLDDFSHEHLMNVMTRVAAINVDGNACYYSPLDSLNQTIQMLNYFRLIYLETKNKTYWWQMIQLLPSSYNQRRTVQMNYEVLRNMYHARRNHKLDCWHTFCEWVETLPHFKDIVLDNVQEAPTVQ